MRGVRIGVDVGSVRIGLAASDPDGLVATPIATLPRATPGATLPPATPGGEADPSQVSPDIAAIAAEVAERSAAVVYVGLPRHLSGAEGAAAGDAREFAKALARVISPVPVRLVDERLTTVSAHRALHAAGRAGRRHREVVDQAAAVIILQTALETERAITQRAGDLVIVDASARHTAAVTHDRTNGSNTGGRPAVDRAGATEDRLR
jgi:putative Holliday junction resolvase